MDDDLRKTLGEAIDAQIKGLAERQAINTAKHLNESYAAVIAEIKKLEDDRVELILKSANKLGFVGLDQEEFSRVIRLAEKLMAPYKVYKEKK